MIKAKPRDSLRIRLVHWSQAEAAERAARVRALGFSVEHEPLDGPAGLNRLRDQPPAAVVIDLSRIPSHGRDVGLALRSYKATRTVPLVFVGGEADKVKRVKELLPDAVYTDWDEISEALPKAIAHPPANPLVPSSRLASYAGAPLIKKLGIKPHSVVTLSSAPHGFEKALGGLPEGAVLRRTPRGPEDLALWFVRSKRELSSRIEKSGSKIGRGGVWIIWPKKSSDVPSDLDQNAVRAAGLAAGLVDYKVCAVDKTWSGLLFVRRKIRAGKG
ncbi:MAG: hypothetical protein AB1715_13850 [Acidobacteriota bacterium]